MDEAAAKAFVQAVSTAHWHMTFDEFKAKTGFVGQYAEDMWHNWQRLNSVMNVFDTATLAKLLQR